MVGEPRRPCRLSAFYFPAKGLACSERVRAELGTASRLLIAVAVGLVFLPSFVLVTVRTFGEQSATAKQGSGQPSYRAVLFGWKTSWRHPPTTAPSGSRAVLFFAWAFNSLRDAPF
jgi:hypothetical protein